MKKNTGNFLRAGIVGCGHWARDAYLPNLIACDEVELRGLCDVDGGRARLLADEYEAGRRARPQSYTDYQQMFEQENLDLVLVPTLAHVRPAITLAALQAGVHVLAAKPMAPTLAEAEAMLESAAQAGCILMVGYNYRFRDDAQVVHRFIREGGLGEPLFARARVGTPGVPSYAPHYVNSLSGGGSLAATGVHPLDLAVWFLGCPELLSVAGQVCSHFGDLAPLPADLEAIRAEYDTEDLVTGYARFAGGVGLATESMWLAPDQIQGVGVEVWGSTGYASLAPLRLLSWGEGDYVDRTEEIAPGLAASFKDTAIRMERELRHFFACVQGREEPLITPREMWTDQAIIEGLYSGGRTFKSS